MRACLWDVLKCPFSLASYTESTKDFLQLIPKTYFVIPSLPGDLSFCMLFKELYKLFRLNLSHKVLLDFCFVLHYWKIFHFYWSFLLPIFKVVFYSLMYSKISVWSVSFFIVFWDPCYFPKFNKHFNSKFLKIL